MNRLVIALVASSALAVTSRAQPYSPTAEENRQIHTKLDELSRALQVKADDALLADVEIYRKAAEWILRYPEEFYNKAYLTNTLAALDRGLARAKELQSGNPSWASRKGRFSRGYRSRVDGSVQPYGLVIPESYDGQTLARLDVVLHGRGATLNEVSFLAAHDSSQPVPPQQDFIQLDVFGRTNNAYRWAGEADVFEAIASVKKRYNIDPRRIVLRGFSMGGAGGWHLGLHYPDLWAAVESGAGFTETKRYAKLSSLPPYQEANLRIYDAMDYALNAFNLPMVGYGSEDDPQLQASVNIREQLAREELRLPGLRVLFLVGPRVGHRFHPDSKKESDQFLNRMLPQQTPDRVRFVTYTTRYNRCFWVTVEAIERHYERAEVDARDEAGKITVKTTNVARLVLDRGQTITLDAQKFSGTRAFEKRGGRWTPAAAASGLRKRHGLQGPIDDAFLDSFLCVRPTGKAWNPAVDDYSRKTLERFGQEYAKFFRGDVRIKDDHAITPADIANCNLILFGDPGNNRLIAQVAAKLPIRWSRQEITLGGQKFSAVDHVPVLIYPNPLNPKRYVVLNSGHTFHEAELRGTNALLFPRLGDYAVVGLSGEVAAAGLFGERWDLSQ